MNRDFYFMKLANKMAKKAYLLNEVPVGAVIVLKNEVISNGFNSMVTKYDPSAHAEILALRRASKVLKNYRITNCELYVTLEPCIMCSGAIINSRISRLVFGAYNNKCSYVNILHNKDYNHHTKVLGGVLESECCILLKLFFYNKRK